MSLTSEHRILRNTVYQIASRLLADVFFFVFYIALSQRFGPAGVGIYSFSLALSTTLFLAADYGLSLYFVREVSRDRSGLRRYLGNFILMRASLYAAAVAALVTLAPLSNLDQAGLRALAAIAAATFFYRFGEIFHAAFNANEDHGGISFLEVLYKLLVLLIGMPLLLSGMPLERVLWAFPASGLAYITTLALLTVRRFGWPQLRPDTALLRSALVHSMPFFFTLLLSNVYLRISVILLGLMRGPEECGVFSLPEKIAELFMVFAGFYRLSLMPSFSRLYVESKQAYRALFHNAMRYVLICALPVSVLFFVMADQIILSLVGPKFQASIPVLRWMCGFLLFSSIRHVLIATLSSMNRQWQWVASQIAGLSVQVVLGVVLIHFHGALGAAIAMTAAEAVMVAAALGFALRRLGPMNLLVLLPRPAVASGVMAAFAVLLLQDVHVLIGMPAAAAACVACLMWNGGLNARDLRFVLESLRPRAVRLP